MYLKQHHWCLYQKFWIDVGRGLLAETVKRANVSNSSRMETEPRWKNYQRWIFHVPKSFLSRLILHFCEIVAHIKATEGEWVESPFRFCSSCILPRLSAGLRMQDCSLPILEPVWCFVINRSVNDILESSWTRLRTFASKCPRDAYDRGWMLIRDHVKFPRSAYSAPEGGSELEKKKGSLPDVDAKKKSFFL